MHGLKMRRVCCTAATGCLQPNSRVWNVIQTELFRTNKEARIKEVTGLIYISVRPNLLRPFNACGMVQRNSSILADRHQCLICRDCQRSTLPLAIDTLTQLINILVDESFWVYTININCIVFYIFCIKKDDTHEK